MTKATRASSITFYSEKRLVVDFRLGVDLTLVHPLVQGGGVDNLEDPVGGGKPRAGDLKPVLKSF